MNKRPLVLTFALVFLAALFFAGRKDKKHKNDHNELPAAWDNTVCRYFEVTKQNHNHSLLHCYDAAGNRVNFDRIVFNALRDGSIKGYRSKDTTSATTVSDSILQLLAGNQAGTMLLNVFDLQEEWQFRQDSGYMVVHMSWLGLYDRGQMAKNEDAFANVEGYSSGSPAVYRGPQFWMNYNELKPVLEKYTTLDPNDTSKKITCAEYFETRQFTSKIYAVPGTKFVWGKSNWLN